MLYLGQVDLSDDLSVEDKKQKECQLVQLWII